VAALPGITSTQSTTLLLSFGDKMWYRNYTDPPPPMYDSRSSSWFNSQPLTFRVDLDRPGEVSEKYWGHGTVPNGLVDVWGSYHPKALRWRIAYLEKQLEELQLCRRPPKYELDQVLGELGSTKRLLRDVEKG